MSVLLPWTLAAAPDPFWREVDASQPAPARPALPATARAFELDTPALRARLDKAPREFTPAATQAPVEITLPGPDGQLARFQVVESPIMAPELAAMFPEIRTYAGQGVDDPLASVRLDLTPAGFHAQVLAPSGAACIDPERGTNPRRHRVYYKRDLRREAVRWSCLVPGNEAGGFVPAGDFLPATSGGTLRTYRLAVAATGEYTQYHGGTVSAGLAAIVTAINRVNGIFETELAIRLVLVANNQLVVYTNPNTDPYSNSNPSSLLTQNQANLDSVIGNANYDVGHVFSTGGGGLAVVAGVCIEGSKARGETGLSAPVGDEFYVDFVAHEIGHQFGAQHSFNGINGNCNGTRSAGSAFEPGSGTTIMGYAGICDVDDVQLHSDPYFHSVSYDSILFYVSSGFGRDCAVTSVTGNNPPNVSAGANFTIPRNTPFQLTATGSDVDGHPLTYCWEERDLGAAQALGSADNGTSPILRVYPPSTSPVRIIPRLANLLNNVSSSAEQLPSTSRTLNFRVTARDNRIGGGGVNAANMTVTVTAAAGPFTVTAPNTAVAWSGPRTITWNVAGTTNSPINASAVDILLSTNGGLDFPIVLAAGVPNDGSHPVTLPNLATTTARIQVKGTGNIFFDVSDANFSISPFTPLPLVTIDTVTLTAEGCSPGNGAVDPGETVTLQFSLKNTGTAPTTNLVATLLALGGVTPLSPAQTYGALIPAGASVSRSFTFLASGTCGGNVAPRLQLQDGSTSLGTIVQLMTLGRTTTATNVFTQPGAISIPSRNAASPYPSTLAVSGLSNPVTKVSVTLSNLSHTEPNDLDVLLVGPAGQAVLLMSDAGGTPSVNNLNLTFDDAAATFLPETTVLSSGTFKPSNFGTNEAMGAPAPAEPYAAALSAFNGTNPNGSWSLYVWDDASQDSGSIANGWRLTVVTQGSPSCCVPPPPPVVDITRSGLDAQLGFATVSGRNYRVEWTSALGTPVSWNIVTGAAVVPGTGGTVSVTDTNALAGPQRFYRVLVLP